MITDEAMITLPLTSEEEEAAKGLEDPIPVGLETGKPLTEGGRPVPTSVYLARLDPLAQEVAAPGGGRYPWRALKSRSAPKPAPSPTLEESEGDRDFEDVAEREGASEEDQDSETETNSGKKTPPVGGRGQVVGGILE
jgi:hypothetical protein